MITTLANLFGWLPAPLELLVAGVLAFFFLWAFLKILAIIMEIIPFL